MTLLKQVNLIVEEDEDLETPPVKDKKPAEETPTDEVEVDDADATDEDDSEEQPEDVGTVAEREGYEKSKKEIFAFGKTRPATLLTKNVREGGLDVTEQYVINPKTGEWSFRVALQGQSEASMKEHTTGKDPLSLSKHLQKKNKVTAHWLADNLDPPADGNIQDADDEGLDKEYAKDGAPNEEDQDAIRSHRSTKDVHESLQEAKAPAEYSKAEKLAWLYGYGAAEDGEKPTDVDFDTAAEKSAYRVGYCAGKSKVDEGTLIEGGHDVGFTFPVDKFPTLNDVRKHINANVEYQTNDPYSDDYQLAKIGVKHYNTGEKSKQKIRDALLDKAEKWEDLLADKFKDEHGKEFWIVAGILAEANMYDKDDEFTKKILAADKIEHPVETQWHHDIMTKHGFKPLTKSGTGFARHYDYENESGHKIRASTGINADHWQDLTNKGKMGYWRDLEPHLKSLKSSGYHGTVKRNDNGKVSDVKVFVPEK